MKILILFSLLSFNVAAKAVPSTALDDGRGNGLQDVPSAPAAAESIHNQFTKKELEKAIETLEFAICNPMFTASENDEDGLWAETTEVIQEYNEERDSKEPVHETLANLLNHYGDKLKCVDNGNKLDYYITTMMSMGSSSSSYILQQLFQNRLVKKDNITGNKTPLVDFNKVRCVESKCMTLLDYMVQERDLTKSPTIKKYIERQIDWFKGKFGVKSYSELLPERNNTETLR